MTDLFNKSGEMTKRISGIAHMGDVPRMDAGDSGGFKKVGTFSGSDGSSTSVLLEVADTEDSRRKGLMGRKTLTDISGMLFEGLSGNGNFWMRGCLIPLDVAFMSGKGVVTKIYSMPVDKEGTELYEYEDGDKTAVEMPFGFFKRNGIKVGHMFKARKLSGRRA